jgi:hypothetical protein
MSLLLPLVILPGAWAQAPATGDLFVTTDIPGARLLVDGVDSGQVTPTMIRGVAAGDHKVTVKTTCSVGEQTVKVPVGAIARAELRLETMPGSLKVTATPATATIKVDGNPVGPSPWTGGDLMCGEHIVVVDAPDYVSQSRRVSVVAGETIGLDVALDRARFGTLVVDVSPFDAMVRLDGKDLGMGPRTIDQVPAGEHALEASHAKFPKAATKLDLAPDSTARVTLSLDAPKGAPRTSVSFSASSTSLAAAPAAAPAATPAPAPAAAPAPAPAAAPAPTPAPAAQPAPTAAAPAPAPAPAPATSTTAPATTAPAPTATTAPATTAPATTTAPAPVATAAPTAGAAAPLPTTSSTTTIKRRSPAGRVAANSLVTAAGLGAGVGAGLLYMQAAEYYDQFLTVTSDNVADQIFENEVKPRQTMAVALGAGALALLGTSGVLWATTDFKGDTVVGVAGTF